MTITQPCYRQCNTYGADPRRNRRSPPIGSARSGERRPVGPLRRFDLRADGHSRVAAEEDAALEPPAAPACARRASKSFEEYYQHLKRLPPRDPEWDAFLQEITTHETYLFRDEAQWDWFRNEYLPGDARQRGRAAASASLRIWSAACSTGDEAFTAACCIAACLPDLAKWKIRILGTDIGLGAVEQAKTGVFGERAMRLVPDDYRRRYLHQGEGRATSGRPSRSLTDMLAFRQHNLMDPLRERPFDLVFLKNVLIYFDRAFEDNGAAQRAGGDSARADCWWPARPKAWPTCCAISSGSNPGCSANRFTRPTAVDHDEHDDNDRIRDDLFAGLEDDSGRAPRDISRSSSTRPRQTLDELIEALLALEAGGGRENIEQLFVAAHRIKGSAASIGLNRIAKLAHLMEDLLQMLVDDGRVARRRRSPTALLACTDGLRQYVNALRSRPARGRPASPTWPSSCWTPSRDVSTRSGAVAADCRTAAATPPLRRTTAAIGRGRRDRDGGHRRRPAAAGRRHDPRGRTRRRPGRPDRLRAGSSAGRPEGPVGLQQAVEPGRTSATLDPPLADIETLEEHRRDRASASSRTRPPEAVRQSVAGGGRSAR